MTDSAAPPQAYGTSRSFYDEVFDQDGRPREHAEALAAELAELGGERLLAAGRRRDAIFTQQGITFDAKGEDGAVRDRPFPLDLVPRIIPADEWTHIKRGLAQRVRALNHFVDDVYHAREIVHAGIVPWSLIVSRTHFARAVHGVRPPGGVYTHVAGCDLVRDADGSWKVLEDNVRTPSGVSYVLENRIAMTRLVPQLFSAYRVRPVDHYPALLLAALRAVAPAAEGEATVVVWTPGPLNSAYFEHAFLARQMGVELVEASDLVVRDDVCYMRTTNGLARVDAIYRRLDDDFIDPLEFRPDSLLGVPGLVRAYRAGTVAIANALGTGVADDKADLPLRAGHDPLLPRGGADAGQRPHLPAERPRAARGRARTAGRTRRQADRRVRGAGGDASARSTPPEQLDALADVDPRGARSGGSPRRSSTCRPSRSSGPTARSSRATSTCARSLCSARRSASCPAG